MGQSQYGTHKRLAMIAAAVLGITGCQSHTPSEQSPAEATTNRPMIVSVDRVSEYIPQNAPKYSAVVNPSRQVDVAFRGNGYVDYILHVRTADGEHTVQEGDFVKAGTLLAKLRAADSEAKIREQRAALDEARESIKRAETALSEAKISLDSSKQVFDRTARLFQSNSVTQPEYDSAKTNVDLNQARVKEAEQQIVQSRASEKRMQAALAQVKLGSEDYNLVSPISGIVVKRSIEIGSLASQGTVGFTLADSDHVKVSFGVPDVELHSLTVGQPISLSSEALPGRTFTGHITEISPDADPRSRVFDITVNLPNKDQALKPGMVTTLRLEHAGADSSASRKLTVPLSSVVRSSSDPNGYSCFVVADQGGKLIAQERKINLGDAFGQVVTVDGPVKLGEQVITSGATRVANGQEVSVSN